MAKVFIKEGHDSYVEIKVVGVEGLIDWLRLAEIEGLFADKYDEMDFTLIAHGRVPGEDDT